MNPTNLPVLTNAQRRELALALARFTQFVLDSYDDGVFEIIETETIAERIEIAANVFRDMEEE